MSTKHTDEFSPNVDIFTVPFDIRREIWRFLSADRKELLYVSKQFTKEMYLYANLADQTLLSHAVKTGNLEAVKLLLQNPTVDISYQRKEKVLGIRRSKGPERFDMVALSVQSIAAKYDRVNVIKLLLQHSKYDFRLASIACRSNSINMVKYLLETKTAFPLSEALQWAVLCNSQSIVKLLLSESEVQVTQRDILNALLKVGSLELAKILIEHPSFIMIKDSIFYSPLPLPLDFYFRISDYAHSTHNITEWVELVRYLTNDPKTNLGASNNILLKTAIRYTLSLDLLEFLLEQPQVNAIKALEENPYIEDYNDFMFDRLLESPKISDEQLQQFLIECCVSDNTTLFEYVLTSRKIDITFNDNIFLVTALGNDSPKVIHVILDLNNAITPTMVFNDASKKNATTVMEFLLESFRDDFEGCENNVLRTVIENGNTAILKLILEILSFQNDEYDFQFALEYVCSMDSRTDMLKLLLNDPRVDPAAEDSRVLKIASKMGRDENVKLLLQDKRLNSSCLNT